MKIWKYELEVSPRQLIYMPNGAKILSVVVQGGIPFLYALVTPEQTLQLRVFRTVCAGEEFNFTELTPYIGTFVIDDWFVGHLFEQPPSGDGDPIDPRYENDYRELKKK